MNKGLLKLALLSIVCASMPAAFTSCTDYDDEISGLQNQIDALRIDVDKLVGLIESGKVITDVKATDDGVVFTMSDGNSYSITNGKDGQPGTAWTIGEDGYWYKDGAKTDYRAIGADGAVGPQGPQGPKGDQGDKGDKGDKGDAGQNGEYYVPNPETGYFDIYRDGKKIGTSDIKWSASADGGVVAVYSGNKLTLSWTDKDGKQQKVDIMVGNQLGTLAFVPSVLSSVGGYPTTDKPFYHIESYLDETKYNPSTKHFIPQVNWNRSNEVLLEYRISPQDAYIPAEAKGSFINRVVTSRADGDKATLMNVASFDVEGANATGTLNVKSTINKTAVAGNGDDIAAFQLWNGQVPFTTDYIAPKTSPVDAVIVNPVATKQTNSPVQYYKRDYAIVGANGESSAFIQSIVPLSATHNLEVAYTDKLDLAPLVDLYATTKSAFLTDLDFNRECMSYKFSLPAEYLSNDAQHTNQQWFAQLDGSEIKVNEKNLTNGPTPALGRTPVVRVDAFMTDNLNQNTRLVASSYIKLKFVEKPSTPGQPVTYSPYTMTERQYEYHNLTARKTLVGQMNWTDVNNQIYGIAHLSSSTFWNYYGGANNQYEVEISTTEKNGAKKVLNATNKTATADNTFTLAQDGIFCEVTLGSGETQTSNIKFEVDNKVKTQNTYKNVNNKGAEYVITITIKSDDNLSRGDVKVIQKFYVLESCKPYEFNPNYYLGDFSYNNTTYPNCVVTKGTNRSGAWKLEMSIAEAFKMIGGQDIFSYYNTVNNVTAINFSLLNIPANNGVQYNPSTHYIFLSSAMTEGYKVGQMKYTTDLVNGETCEFDFNVVFQNPFKAGDLKAHEIDGNAIGTVTENVKPSVKVVDTKNNTIYSWVGNDLDLSSVANNTYKLNRSMVGVKYDFVHNADYDAFTSQLAPGAKFEVDQATGVITYDNLGAALQRSFNLIVRATVTFQNISVVKCDIPVHMKGNK